MHIVGNLINQYYTLQKEYRLWLFSTPEDLKKDLINTEELNFVFEHSGEIIDFLVFFDYPNLKEFGLPASVGNAPIIQIITNKISRRKEQYLLFTKKLQPDWVITTSHEAVQALNIRPDFTIEPFSSEKLLECLKIIKNKQ